MFAHTIPMPEYEKIDWKIFKERYSSFRRTSPTLDATGFIQVTFLFEQESDVIVFRLAHK